MTRMRSIVSLVLLLALAISVSDAAAKAPPGWDRKIRTSSRFKLVLGEFAVLDQETGLVWQRKPGTSPSNWALAAGNCLASTVGDRRGWRLPRADELQSLMDTTQSNPPLPPGHPFVSLNTDFGSSYWTATDTAGNTGSVYSISFFGDGQFLIPSKSSGTPFGWCVRGPGGVSLD